MTGHRYHDRSEFKPTANYYQKRTVDSEYASNYQQDRRIQAEKRLLGALLERALADALYSTGRMPGKSNVNDSVQAAKKHARQAYQWIIGKPDPLHPPRITFEYACQGLDLDPKVLRAVVIKAKNDNAKFKRAGTRGGSKNELRLCIPEE